jgi:hypothetical protein
MAPAMTLPAAPQCCRKLTAGDLRHPASAARWVTFPFSPQPGNDTTMMPTEISTELNFPTDVAELSELLLRVARRADELARRSVVLSRATDRWLWLRAEFEVFELLERAYPCRLPGGGAAACIGEAVTRA